MTSIPTTQYLPRFYCDEMLGRLARYLRAAGFDTRLASDGMKDNVILREAVLEARWLVTRDTQILEQPSAESSSCPPVTWTVTLPHWPGVST
jgi:uncharacterized protein with PIN domain